MRIVVFSDSHGDRYSMFEALLNEPLAEYVYFLGDGYREFEDLECAHEGKHGFVKVRGNCDFGCDFPARDIRTINDCKIYATHGYVERVKYGIYDLEYEARKENCKLVLFGHTHEKLNTYRDGIYFFNPGSLRDWNYGVVDITDNGIICIHKTI